VETVVGEVQVEVEEAACAAALWTRLARASPSPLLSCCSLVERRVYLSKSSERSGRAEVPNAHFNFLSMPAAVRRRWRDPLKYSCPPFYRRKPGEQAGGQERRRGQRRGSRRGSRRRICSYSLMLY
jgi:hypothetical protein